MLFHSQWRQHKSAQHLTWDMFYFIRKTLRICLNAQYQNDCEHKRDLNPMTKITISDCFSHSSWNPKAPVPFNTDFVKMSSQDKTNPFFSSTKLENNTQGRVNKWQYVLYILGKQRNKKLLAYLCHFNESWTVWNNVSMRDHCSLWIS